MTNLVDVLNSAQSSGNPSIWFRPISWQGSGEAFRISDDGLQTLIVPTSRNGHQMMTALVAELMEPWELVNESTVKEEAKWTSIFMEMK